MRLIVVRHGESIGNVKKIIQGQIRNGLTKKGFSQAKKLGKKLSKENIEIVYSSDLPRAKETVREVKKILPKIKINFTKKLRERYFGKLQGKQKFKNWEKIIWRKDFGRKENVESFDKILKRVNSFLKTISKKHKGKIVLLITHKRIVQIIMAIYKNPTLDYIQKMSTPRNVSIKRFDFSRHNFIK